MAVANMNQEFVVFFSEINGLIELGQDLECKFYLESSNDIGQDKIKLCREKWTSQEDKEVVKNVNNSTTDEFNERKITFKGYELPDDIYNKYQFNYFHFNANTQTYHLKGQSNSFNFYKSYSQAIQQSPDPRASAPPQSVYPQFNAGGSNNTEVKRLYDQNNGQHQVIQNPYQIAIRDMEYKLSEKERELNIMRQNFEHKEKMKDMEMEKLKNDVMQSEDQRISFERSVRENELAHQNQNQLLENINAINEKLRHTEEKALHFEKRCTELETEIDKLNTELAISHSELDHFKSTPKSAELSESRVQRENSSSLILRERLQESDENNELLKKQNIDLEKVKIRLEVEIDHLKNNMDDLKKKLDKKDDYCIELKAQLRAQELITRGAKESPESTDIVNKSYNNLIVESRRLITNIKIFEGEMDNEVQEFCLNLSTNVLKRFSNIKSMSDSMVIELDKKYGRKWHCFMGNSFEHSSLMHEFGTYLSFAINELRIIVYKTDENLDPRDVLLLAKESKNVEVLNKSESVEETFQKYVISLLKNNDHEFISYSEMSTHLTQLLNIKLSLKYGSNWSAICGQSDRFDSSMVLNNKLVRLLELQVEKLKIIIMQFDDHLIKPAPRSSLKSTDI